MRSGAPVRDMQTTPRGGVMGLLGVNGSGDEAELAQESARLGMESGLALELLEHQSGINPRMVGASVAPAFERHPVET